MLCTHECTDAMNSPSLVDATVRISQLAQSDQGRHPNFEPNSYSCLSNDDEVPSVEIPDTVVTLPHEPTQYLEITQPTTVKSTAPGTAISTTELPKIRFHPIDKTDTPTFPTKDYCDTFNDATLAVTVATKNLSETAQAKWDEGWFASTSEHEQEIRKKKKRRKRQHCTRNTNKQISASICKKHNGITTTLAIDTAPSGSNGGNNQGSGTNNENNSDNANNNSSNNNNNGTSNSNENSCRPVQNGNPINLMMNVHQTH